MAERVDISRCTEPGTNASFDGPVQALAEPKSLTDKRPYKLTERKIMDIQFGNPHSIWLLALAAAGLALTGYAIVARRRAALKFATARNRRQLMPSGPGSRTWLSALLVLPA